MLLVDEEDQVSLGAYVGNVYDAVAATFPAPLAKSPAGRAIHERRVVHYPDVANDPQVHARGAPRGPVGRVPIDGLRTDDVETSVASARSACRAREAPLPPRNWQCCRPLPIRR